MAGDAYIRRYFGELKALIEESYEKTRSCDSGPKRASCAETPPS
jgi:hypothetical protein